MRRSSVSRAVAEPPARRAGGLEQGGRLRRPDRSRAACVDERRGAAVEDGLGSADGEDQVGVEERGMSSERPILERRAVEARPPRSRGRSPRRETHERGRVAAAPRAHVDPARRPSPPATSTVTRSRGTPARASSSSTAASASRRGSSSTAGSGSAGGWTTTVARPSRGATASQAVARERVAQRLGDGSRNVDDRIERRRDGEELCVVGERDEGELRARVERHAWHERQS